MNILDLAPSITHVIDRILPDPTKAQEMKMELAKIQADENVARMGVLQVLLSNKNLFVAGAIPALIWIGVLSILNNYVLMPWVQVFGISPPQIDLPTPYWELLGWIITGLFGKKIVDDNAWFWKGKLISPSKKSIEASVVTGKAPVEKILEQEEQNKASMDYIEKRFEELTKKFKEAKEE